MATSLPPKIESVASAWIAEAQEVYRPINTLRPLWVRHDLIESGEPMQRTAPHPEQHPYCEVSFIFSGENIQYIGAGQIERKAGDLLLMGPHTPHYARFQKYPYRSVTVHFLPVVLCGMGPAGDGTRLLARFTAVQDIQHRAVRLSPDIRARMEHLFEEMVREVATPGIGCQLRLLALLIETLVDLVRWEHATGRAPTLKPETVDWPHVEKALRFIHEHHSTNLYIEQIAKAAGLSVSMMQSSFRRAMGVSCVRYIRAYRISRALALLGEPCARVTEISMEVGFETLSHFNTSFRELTGMSPTEYIRSCRRFQPEKPTTAEIISPKAPGKKPAGQPKNKLTAHVPKPKKSPKRASKKQKPGLRK